MVKPYQPFGNGMVSTSGGVAVNGGVIVSRFSRSPSFLTEALLRHWHIERARLTLYLCQHILACSLCGVKPARVPGDHRYQPTRWALVGPGLLPAQVTSYNPAEDHAIANAVPDTTVPDDAFALLLPICDDHLAACINAWGAHDLAERFLRGRQLYGENALWPFPAAGAGELTAEQMETVRAAADHMARDMLVALEDELARQAAGDLAVEWEG